MGKICFLTLQRGTLMANKYGSISTDVNAAKYEIKRYWISYQVEWRNH